MFRLFAVAPFWRSSRSIDPIPAAPSSTTADVCASGSCSEISKTGIVRPRQQPTMASTGASHAHLTIRYFFVRFLRGPGTSPAGYSARMIRVLGNMVSPPCSAASISASIAGRHSGASAPWQFGDVIDGITQRAQLAEIGQGSSEHGKDAPLNIGGGMDLQVLR